MTPNTEFGMPWFIALPILVAMGHLGLAGPNSGWVGQTSTGFTMSFNPRGEGSIGPVTNGEEDRQNYSSHWFSLKKHGKGTEGPHRATPAALVAKRSYQRALRRAAGLPTEVRSCMRTREAPNQCQRHPPKDRWPLDNADLEKGQL